MIQSDFNAAALSARLRSMSKQLGDMAPLLEAILDGLEKLGADYAERAQRIPLAESTLRRKQYARKSVQQYEKERDRRIRIERYLLLTGARRKALGRNQYGVTRTKNAIAVPSAHARVLERVGGFLESFTPEQSQFDVRTINREAGTLRFGSKLGGLWKLHGTGYTVGKRKVTQVPARFPFGFSDESRREIADVIEKAQTDFVEEALT